MSDVAQSVPQCRAGRFAVGVDAGLRASRGSAAWAATILLVSRRGRKVKWL
jgi:hypothetical protein